MIWERKSKDFALQDGQDGAGAKPAFPWKKHLKWMIPAVCVLAVAGLLWWKSRPAAPAAVSVQYMQEPVMLRTVSRSLSGYGTLKPANTYTVKSLVAGEALAAPFEEGDVVELGAVLYELDSSATSTNIEKSRIALEQAQRSYDKTADRRYVRAEVGGTVCALKVSEGDEVTAGQEVAVVRGSATMLLRLEFPAADAAGFVPGQNAQVVLDGTFEVLDGTVTAVSGADELSTGNLLTRTVTIAVANAGGLTSAQAATASINGISSTGSACFAYQAEKTLTAQVSGTVVSVQVREGGQVSKGDILLTLAGEELDEQIQAASESLRSAQLSMDSAQQQVNDYTITSPIRGTIVEKKYKQGDTVEAGQSLCVIYDLSYLEMTINVDELDISSIQVGQTVEITADALPTNLYTGQVTRVSVAGTTSGGTTTYPVSIRIDETSGLLPGMNANAEIVVARAENALTIPNAAVVRGGYVLVTVDSPSAAGALADREAPEGYVYVAVTTGVSDDNYVEITSGLQEGDTVGYDPSIAGFGGDMGYGGYYYGEGGYVG